MLIHNVVFLQMDGHKCCYKRVVCFEKNHTYSRGYFFLKLHLKLHLSKNLMQFHDLFLNILKKKKKDFLVRFSIQRKKDFEAGGGHIFKWRLLLLVMEIFKYESL